MKQHRQTDMTQQSSHSCVSFHSLQGTNQPLPSNRKTVEEGKTKVLHCSLDASAPTTGLYYAWTKDDKNIMANPQSSRISIILDGSLYIKSTQRTDTGVYQCTAKALDSTGTQIISYPGVDIFLDVQCKYLDLMGRLHGVWIALL